MLLHRYNPAHLPAAISLALAIAGAHGARAQGVDSRPVIRQCGTLLSDRLDAGCGSRKQVLLRADGLQRVTEEPGAAENDPVDDRAAELRDINLQKRLERRRGQSLLTLFPDEARHQAARARDLASEERPVRVAEHRIEDLRVERQRLTADAAIHGRGKLPPELKLRLERNESAWQEARATIAHAEAERALVGRNYDEVLTLLRKLWATRAGS